MSVDARVELLHASDRSQESYRAHEEANRNKQAEESNVQAIDNSEGLQGGGQSTKEEEKSRTSWSTKVEVWSMSVYTPPHMTRGMLRTTANAMTKAKKMRMIVALKAIK